MQVINRQPVEGSFGNAFDQAMNQITQLKMQDLLQRHQGQQFQKLVPGMSPEKASAFAALPPLAQKEFIRSGLLSSLQDSGQPQQQDMLQALMSQVQQQPQRQQQQPLQKVLGQQAPGFGVQDALQRSLAGGMSPEQQYQLAQQQAQQPTQQPTQQMMKPEQQKAIPEQQVVTQPQQFIQRAKQIQQEKIELDPVRQQLEKLKANPMLTTAQKMAITKQEANLQKEQRAEEHKITKELMPVHKKLIEEYKGAIDDDRRLNRMEALVNKGNLTRPRWHSFLNSLEHGIFGLGVNLHSLETADSQEFDKLSKEFLKNAKNVFGSRITDNDVKVFMKMVPDLAQSREGKLAIIDNMKTYNQGIKLRKQASDAVLKSNNNKFPVDYEERIEKIVGPQLDALSQKFTTQERPQPKVPVKSLWENIKTQDPLNILFGQG